MDATAGLTVLGFPLGIMHRMHYIERIDIKDGQVTALPSLKKRRQLTPIVFLRHWFSFRAMELC